MPLHHGTAESDPGSRAGLPRDHARLADDGSGRRPLAVPQARLGKGSPAREGAARQREGFPPPVRALARCHRRLEDGSDHPVGQQGSGDAPRIRRSRGPRGEELAGVRRRGGPTPFGRECQEGRERRRIDRGRVQDAAQGRQPVLRPGAPGHALGRRRKAGRNHCDRPRHIRPQDDGSGAARAGATRPADRSAQPTRLSRAAPGGVRRGPARGGGLCRPLHRRRPVQGRQRYAGARGRRSPPSTGRGPSPERRARQRFRRAVRRRRVRDPPDRPERPCGRRRAGAGAHQVDGRSIRHRRQHGARHDQHRNFLLRSGDRGAGGDVDPGRSRSLSREGRRPRPLLLPCGGTRPAGARARRADQRAAHCVRQERARSLLPAAGRDGVRQDRRRRSAGAMEPSAARPDAAGGASSRSPSTPASSRRSGAGYSTNRVGR